MHSQIQASREIGVYVAQFSTQGFCCPTDQSLDEPKQVSEQPTETEWSIEKLPFEIGGIVTAPAVM